MKIYLVEQGEYMEGSTIVGLFRTKIKAVKRLRQVAEKHKIKLPKQIEINTAYFCKEEVDYVVLVRRFTE